MSTTLHNLYGSLVHLTHTFGAARRQRPTRVMQVEGLEERVLLSAASMLVIEPQVQHVNIIDQLDQSHNQNQNQNQDNGVADTNHGEADASALHFGSLKHMGMAKQANPNAKAAVFNRNNFAGDWNLGIGGQAPNNTNVLHIQQFGRKVTATLEQTGTGIIAVMTGRIKQGEFVADLTGTQAPATGSLKLQKTSNTQLIGILTINFNQNPQSVGITGAK